MLRPLNAIFITDSASWMGEATVLRQGCRNRAYMDVLAACRRPIQLAGVTTPDASVSNAF